MSVGNRVTFTKELGGDYYHFARLKDGLFFCLADISGKSTAAALFAALLDQSISEASKQASDLATIVSDVNS